MSQEFILRLAHMAHSRPPSRAHRRYHSAGLASTQDGKIRARRPRATGPIEINGEEEDGGDDVDVEMKVDSWDHTNENTAATKQLDPITARQFQNSCVECQDMPCRRHVFSFMSLPTEIRLQIYRLALARDTPVLLHIAKPKAVKQEETQTKNLCIVQEALHNALVVCESSHKSITRKTVTQMWIDVDLLMRTP